jgi:hypothetical protein
MPIQAPVKTFPDTTSVAVIALEELRSPRTRLGLDYWRMLRGTRCFPTRDEIKPRDIAGALTNMVLVKVLNGGADFQFRIVGHHASLGYHTVFTNRLFSDVAVELPRASQNWGNICRLIVDNGAPIAVRVLSGFDAPEANFAEAEAVFLPLGGTEHEVDHVLTFVEHVLRT